MPVWAALGFVAALAVVVAAPARAQETSMAEGWHVVRPGETLRAIAERYLGSVEDWTVLAGLNPEIADPNQISPAQRIRVRVAAGQAVDVAKLTKVSRRVDEQLSPHPWSPALEENLLNPDDGVRTFESSSAELLFMDATRLLVSEDSLVFIGRGGEVEQGVRREEIEVIVGQAELDGVAAQSYEFVVGESRLRPAADGEGRSQSRVRRPEAGGAQLMVYAGESVVESGGAQQEVGTGMGTQMQDGAPPSPPEKLLPAGRLSSPAAGSAWPIANPPFTWEAVEGAASYVLELCHDAECTRLAARHLGLTATDFRPPELEEGIYHWRVTAVSPSGLDGYPTAASSFSVEPGVDLEAPNLTVELEGVRAEWQGRLYLGVGARWAVAIDDEGTGVERAWIVLDGEERSLDATEAAWELGPWAPGAHELEIVARDRAGNEARSGPLAFVYDPLPPVLNWRLDTGTLYRSFDGVNERFEKAHAEGKLSRALRDLQWSTGEEWRPVDGRRWEIGGRPAPSFELRTLRGKQRLYAAEDLYLRLGRQRGVVLEAVDDLSGTRVLAFEVERDTTDPLRARWLVVEAEDRVGNRSSVIWPLWRGRSAGVH
jgi:hypothetical protein